VKKQGGAFSNVFAQLFFVALVGLVSIVLSNLIIGLTVHNISELRHEASLYRLSKSMKLIIESTSTLENYPKIRRFLKLCKNIFGISTKLSQFFKDANGHQQSICIQPQKEKIALRKKLNVQAFDTVNGKAAESFSLRIPGKIIKLTEKALAEKNTILEELVKEYESFLNAGKLTPSYNFNYSEEISQRKKSHVALGSPDGKLSFQQRNDVLKALNEHISGFQYKG